eukprot:3012357-Lingulodinium_polyedra.AAC.1
MVGRGTTNHCVMVNFMVKVREAAKARLEAGRRGKPIKQISFSVKQIPVFRQTNACPPSQQFQCLLCDPVGD